MGAEKALVSIQEKAFAIFSFCSFLFSPVFSRASANLLAQIRKQLPKF
jgi:hypothetical protein